MMHGIEQGLRNRNRERIAGGRCPLYREEAKAIHILLESSEIWRLKDQYPSTKWLNINDKVAHKRIITCTNIT